MGMSLISSSGLLPKINWAASNVTLTAGAGATSMTASVETRVRRVIIRSDSANAVNISFGPSTLVNYNTLTPGDEYVIESAPGHTFDLAVWYASCTGSNTTLRIIYQ